jgi:hypothetical protein
MSTGSLSLESEEGSLTHSSVIVIAATVFILSSKRFVKTPPHGSAVIDAVKIVTIAVKEGGFDNARPTALQARGALERHHFAQSPNFTDESVKDVQSGITACKVCLQLRYLMDLDLVDMSIVLPLPASILRLLDPDLEQSYLASGSHGVARHSKRSAAKS